MRISRHDLDGVKPLLQTGEFGYDNYPAGGDMGRVYVGTGTENIPLAKQVEMFAVDEKADVHIARVDNPHGVTKAQVGLGNADNTADINKVVASAGRLTAGKKINNVVFDNTQDITINVDDIDASKITSGVIDAARLPSYVDDVLEFSSLDDFPLVGETGKIYVAIDTNKTYRWSVTSYIYITSGAVDSVAGKTGVVILNKNDVGLNQVDNTSDVNKPISTATVNALALKANIESPAFTGVPTAPTAVVGNETTQVATTAFVGAEIADKAYSKTQLNAGQLDNRYYTETEIDTLYSTTVNLTGNQTITGVKTFMSTIVGNVTGNSATTTKLATARTINGVAFDGTANIVAPTNLTIGTRTTTAVPIESSSGTNASIPVATTTLAGVMSSADKVKLDGIAAGVMSSADKVKLDGIAAGAQVNVATNLGITAGTTAGPIVTSSTGTSATLPAASATESGVVTTGVQTIAGVKTFSSSPVVPTPTTDFQVATKKYVDSASGGAWVANDSRVKTALNASGTAPIYACRAWVNFNGTGTVAIRASGNVSSITDNGVGNYTVNFTTAMVDANYSAVYGANANISGYAGSHIQDTTYVRVFGSVSGSANELSIANIAIFR